MHKAIYYCLFCTLCLAPTAVTSDTTPRPRTIGHQGVERTYYVALPAGFDPAAIYWPLVMVHGGGGKADKNRWDLEVLRLRQPAMTLET